MALLSLIMVIALSGLIGRAGAWAYRGMRPGCGPCMRRGFHQRLWPIKPSEQYGCRPIDPDPCLRVWDFFGHVWGAVFLSKQGCSVDTCCPYFALRQFWPAIFHKAVGRGLMKKFQNDGARLTLYTDAPIIDMPGWQGKTFAIGQHKFKTLESGLDLLGQASAYARQQGAKCLIGPMDGDTWHAYRLIIDGDGRAPFLLEPETGPHDLLAFQQAGFGVVSSYFSADVALADALKTDALDLRDPSALNAPPDIEISPWNGQDPEALFREVHSLSLKAFSQNPFFKPIGIEAFLDIYLPLVPFLEPEFFAVCRSGITGGRCRGFYLVCLIMCRGRAPHPSF